MNTRNQCHTLLAFTGVLLSLMLCTATVAAQDYGREPEPPFTGNATLSGRVTLANGQPVAGVQVYAFFTSTFSITDGETEFVGTTGADGRYDGTVTLWRIPIRVTALRDGYSFAPGLYTRTPSGPLGSYTYTDLNFVATPPGPPTSPTNNVVISSTSGGSTSDSGSVEVPAGDSLSVSATPNDGYVFLGWAGDSTSNNTDITLNNIQSDTELLAVFSKEGTGALAGDICDAGSGAWRIFGEKNWRTGLEGANNLEPGLYLVEFRNVNGKRSPDYFKFTVTEEGLIRHDGCYSAIVPVVHYFTATPEIIGLAGQTTINWLVRNASQREIDQGIGPISPSGKHKVDVNDGLSLVLEATNSNGSDTESLSPHVRSPISIASLTASETRVRPNSVVTITWYVLGATELRLNGKNLPNPGLIGSQKFKVTETTDFILEAKDGTGAEEVALVRVAADPNAPVDNPQPGANLPDLEVEIDSITASATDKNMLDVVATVKNSGDVPAKFIPLTILEDLKPRHTEIIRRLAPGQQQQVSLSYVTPKNGSRRIDARVDHDNEIFEIQENNNRDMTRLRQQLWPGPDLVVTNVRITQAEAGSYLLQAQIVNAGKSDSDGFQYQFFTSRVPFKLNLNRQDLMIAHIPELKAGEVYDFEMLISLDQYTNVFYLHGWVDTLEAIQESDEENNKRFFLFRKKWIQ